MRVSANCQRRSTNLKMPYCSLQKTYLALAFRQIGHARRQSFHFHLLTKP